MAYQNPEIRDPDPHRDPVASIFVWMTVLSILVLALMTASFVFGPAQN